MIDWADQLADFGLEYEQRRAIKAQPWRPLSLSSQPDPCSVRKRTTSRRLLPHIRVRSRLGNQPPIGAKMEYAIKFIFLGSNNEAEYEALVLGLQLCILAGATTVNAKSDSQLIVGQVLDEYAAKEDNTRMYLAKTEEVLVKLYHFHISHIPCSKNQQADALARMAG